MLPSFEPREVADGSFSVATLYGMTDQLAALAVEREIPIIAVVLKQVDHLQRLAETLHDVVYPQVRSAGRPFHLLVLDDEADDSSIGENDLEASSSLQERQVPRRIVDLWESRLQPGTTAAPQLRATYLAYTATPQANFLQDQANPLAPRDFVVCLRTPGAQGDRDKREPGYRVPEGLPGWYTGGDVFYRTLADVPLCLPVDEIQASERLLHGLRGFLVASAVRLSRSSAPLGPREASVRTFSSRAEAESASGPVMSMLVHPSATKDAHFDVAGQVLAWSAGLPPSEGARLIAGDDRNLRLDGITADMDEHPDRWTWWLSEYATGQELITKLPPQVPFPAVPDWEALRELILDEIAPATSVAVINSDDRADDRPSFEPVVDAEGWRPAPNICTVFVSGNVMSRGLTLEGLSTTVFTRSSEDPATDTQMQMQRWFGYRGKYIDVCRVLASAGQISLFGQYHETDVALRTQILNAMSDESPASPSVLQGRTFKATGKIKNVAGRSPWPGADPFMAVVNDPYEDETNQRVVADLFTSASVGVPDDRGSQGRILDRTLSLVETADVLDQLRYPPVGDGGGIDPVAARMWDAIQRIAGLDQSDDLFPLLRMPANTDPAAWGTESPFNVAAYLRFWKLCLDERLPAAFSTEDPPLVWSLLDLATRRREQPRFRVGLRMGPGSPVSAGPLAHMPWSVKPMERTVEESRVKGGWGSRNYRDGVLWGDEFFDCYRTGELPRLNAGRAREHGSDGLLLFHVVAHRGGNGVVIAPALSIPLGGPDQVHSRRRRQGG